jgi:phosphoglucosamine mutase
MLTRSMRCDLGVMLSASAQPIRRQRHQAFRSRRLKLSDEVEARIEALMDGEVALILARAREG